MLSVCAWCRKVRNVRGEWKLPEVPVHETSRIALTHGICPVCAEKVLAEDGPEKLVLRQPGKKGHKR